MSEDKLRVDKWLWAARFFKTRSLAAAAATNGRVRVNGLHVKAAHPVKSGDTIEVSRGDDNMELSVTGLSARRGPADAAALLYRETEASASRRAQERAARALRPVAPAPPRRPDKRARRELTRFLRGD